ncbi:MAG: sigma-70 family RNA polymerase sigma factor [Gemmatales bacterium]
MSQTTRHRFLSWMKPETDESLLQRYLARQDEAAFGILVRRYIQLISSVCRKELPNAIDVEDACQATFLILAQRAGSIRQQDSLRSWLHGVAIRVSKAMRRRAIRMERRDREQAITTAISSPAEILADADVQDLVRREVEGLPEQYRLPLQLCYWHGQSRDEMASTLGWTRGQVKGQLERAKRRLKARLDQRGIQFLLPLGMGLTTIGLATVLPAMATAATTVTTSATMGTMAAHFASLFYRVFQATKGIATLGFLAVAMGFAPPIPFLPIFPEEPNVVPETTLQEENEEVIIFVE